jgi:hypothetical protein
MRILAAALFALAITGCATAVYDSLERRGVDAKSILVERVTDVRADALAADKALGAAIAALNRLDGLEGPALARQIDAARAAGNEAAVKARDLRLSTSSAGAAGARYLREWEEEIGLYPTQGERDAAAARLAADRNRHRALVAALETSNLRLSPALSLYAAEVDALRRNATSGVVAASRKENRDAAARAGADASAGLKAAINAADGLLAALQ